MRERPVRIAAVAVLIVGCASLRNTPAQDLIYEAWRACQREGRIDLNVTLDHVEPDGSYWVRTRGGQAGRQAAFDCMREKTQWPPAAPPLRGDELLSRRGEVFIAHAGGGSLRR
jgi:hypothetical protein